MMSSRNFKIFPTGVERAKEYAHAVADKKLRAGKRVKQACSRFIRELEWQNNPDYEWCFDIDKANRPVDFIEKFHKPTKGDYDRMTLLGWQCFCQCNMYGWVSKETGYRRFREALIIVGAGNGKSTMVGGNATYGVSKDYENGAEVYLLANSKEQARIIFDEVSAEVSNNKILSKHLKVLKNGIYHEKTHSKIQPLATDSKTQKGRNVHLAIFDELQDYTNYKLITTIKGKGKKRRQPLIIYITTLGTVIDGPLMDLYVLGGNILDDVNTIDPKVADQMFVYIAEIDEEDDADDSSNWIKANPSLGVTLHLDVLEKEWARMKLVPAERSDFINQQLNVWTSVDELSYLDVEVIKRNDKEIDIELLEGRTCYGGFDLSSTEDFTSACLEFDISDIIPGAVFYLSHTWVPEKKVKLNQENLDWDGLQRDGLLTVVKGEYVDYNLIYKWFVAMNELYNIHIIGYDPAKASMLVKLLESNGFTMEPVRQGELTLTAPLDDMKEKYLCGNIVHNNNRLFNWYLGNVKLSKRSAGNTYLPTKQSKYRKIDGFAASLDGHTVYLRHFVEYIPEDAEVATVISLR